MAPFPRYWHLFINKELRDRGMTLNSVLNRY